MLVLSRDSHESVVITASNGERITVTVLIDPHGDLVKLAFDAPRQVKILRAELLEKTSSDQQ